MRRLGWAWFSAVVVLAQMRSAAAQTRSDCPDPAPLYALRGATPRDWTRLLHLRTARRRESWEFSLRSITPVTSDHCATATMVVRRGENNEESARMGPEMVEQFRALLDVEPRRSRVRVVDRTLLASDPRLRPTEGSIDIDGDGVPENIVISRGGEGGDDHCGSHSEINDECVACEIPGGESLRIDGSRGQPVGNPIFYSGRPRSASFEARVEAALRSARPADNGTFESCPSIDAGPMGWMSMSRQSSPFLRRTDDGFVLEYLVGVSLCHGWNEEPSSHDDPCPPARSVLVTYPFRGSEAQPPTSVRRTEAAIVPISPTCAGCTVSAFPWSLPDGDRTPHRVSVTIRPAERVSHVRATPADGLVRLPPGWFVVEVSSPAGVQGVWQVLVLPADSAPISVGP